jgi:hypothetical protein
LQNFEKIEKNSDQASRDGAQFTPNKDKCIGKRILLMGYQHNRPQVRNNIDRRGAYSQNKTRIT